MEVGVGGEAGGWLLRPRCCGSVRHGSAQFDTILGESIVETAMFTDTYKLKIVVYVCMLYP